MGGLGVSDPADSLPPFSRLLLLVSSGMPGTSQLQAEQRRRIKIGNANKRQRLKELQAPAKAAIQQAKKEERESEKLQRRNEKKAQTAARQTAKKVQEFLLIFFS